MLEAAGLGNGLVRGVMATGVWAVRDGVSRYHLIDLLPRLWLLHLF